MSLFKLCPWWSTQCPDLSPSYDAFSLLCCRMGLAENEKDYIVVGSHTGYLSVYQPIQPGDDVSASGDDMNNKDFATPLDAAISKAIDLVLEVKLALPIIGISSGRFVGSKNGNQIQLALLHPMKVSIYAIQTTEGIAAHGTQPHLELCLEHKLRSFAFSMCKGNFGRVKGKEFLCVTHINGSISVFEQDGISYECALSGAEERSSSIPSILCYVPRIDSFVTVSVALDMECYSYQDFVQSSAVDPTSIRNKTIDPTWSVCVGEFALDVDVLQISNDESIIMILGENNLISMTDSGQVRFIKRLDYTPMCFHSYIIGWYWEPDARLITAIASEHGSLLIYEEAKLIWSLQMPDNRSLVALKRSNLQGLPGALVTLGDAGLITVGYLGSEPHLFQVPALNMQRVNVESAQAELIELEKEIRAGLDFSDNSILAHSAERDLQVKMTKSPKLESAPIKSRATNLSSVVEDVDLKKCLVSISLKAGIKIDQIQLYFVVAPPLKCTKPLSMFRQVEVNHTERIDTWVFNEGSTLPSSLDVRAVVSFINTQSICRIIEKTIRLPLEMFFKVCPPVKEDSSIKITLTIEGFKGPIPSVASLFSNSFAIETNAQAIGLRSITTPNAVTTIVTAKNSNRYRMQTNDVCGLPLIFDTMCCRFNASNPAAAMDQSALAPRMVVSPPIPVNEVLSAIDEHNIQRELVSNVLARLEARTSQMRIVQRRMFVKLEDKKAGSLDGIRLLFARTQEQISEILRTLDVSMKQFVRSQVRLSSVIALTQKMISHMDVAPKTKEGICAALVSPISDWMDQGWEEITGSSLELLNHIGPLKKSKHNEFDENPIYASTAFDVHRFKRHLVALVERVCRLSGAQTDIECDDELDDHGLTNEGETIPETSEWVNEVMKLHL